MKLSLFPGLIPAHIDGFLIQSDFRLSRFSAVGASAPRRAAEHSRAELELTLALRGRAQVLLETQRVQVGARDMLWIRPQQRQLVIGASDDFLAWVAVFRRRLVRRVCTGEGGQLLRALGEGAVPLRRIAQPEVRTLSNLYAGIPVGEGREVFNAGLGYVLTRSWLAYQRAGEARVPDEVHPAVRTAAWLLRDGNTDMCNSRLAREVGLSPQRLSRLFKQQMGTALADFRNRERIARVVGSLGDGTASLTELALAAGFGSYSQFHRAFRQRMGCAPADFLRLRRVGGPPEPDRGL